MRHCFYHTDFGQDAVFHNFAIQMALIQYSGLSKHAWAQLNHYKKKFQNHPYSQPVLTFAVRAVGRVFEWTLRELRSNKIKNVLCYFILWFYQCVIFKSVWGARHFEYSCKRCSLNDWTQMAQWLKLQRHNSNYQQSKVQWNIYRDNNFHSQQQALKKCH